MNYKRVMQVLHTVRYLKFKQIYYRIYYRLFQLSKSKIIPTLFTLRVWQHPWQSLMFFQSTLTPRCEITVLGERGSIKNAFAWNNPKKSKLWLYNLHYFEELNTTEADLYIGVRVKLIERWIAENPPIQGIGWEPYPLSIRIVNWVKWLSRHKTTVTPVVLASLGAQIESLNNQLEYHNLGNHLYANAKALVFSGSFLGGDRADFWLKKGLKILDKEMEEQFLPDGGHFELSPMYHAILVWDMCDLVNLAQRSKITELQLRQAKWIGVIVRGMNWLKTMIHPDEQISFFNDATFNIAPKYSELVLYAKSLGLLVLNPDRDFSYAWLKNSGYCGVELGNQSKAIIDIAALGPDYQPGHAHADTLSFELSLYGQRFLVNSGINQYGDDAQRQYQRSTKAHNTITVNDEDSSEMWAGFRVARRAYPKNRVLHQNEQIIFIAASHDGFKRLPGRNIHRREWTFTRNKLVLRDKIRGAFVKATARFYFHPLVKLSLIGDNVLQCQLLDGQQVCITIHDGHNLTLKSSFWYPQFGTQQENQCLVIQLKHNELLTEFLW